VLPGFACGQSQEGEGAGAEAGEAAPDHAGAGATQREAHTGDKEFRFVYVGRLEAAKGVFVALEAMAAARISGHRLTLSLLGWGPGEEQAKARCHELGLEEVVRFHGAGGPAQVAALMRDSDCLIIPSFRDSIPLVFGEALQTGIPLIVTDVGDMGNLTRKHNLGKVVKPGSVAELAAAMSELVSGGPPAGCRDRMRKLLRRFLPSVAAEDFLSAAFGKEVT
jgi:glycosyltransferase involved in cell wall biosynthesis